ncbi:MAG: NAD(P)-dependent alcohol dehydrogenase [Candidatus Aminicenantes bacterium]|nr:NAD(P)-dependent alcohol dehydrogenase [Candidatus Aminicenantes bacterium]
MKAIIYDKYGPPEVLQLKEVEKPVPKDNEVLIRVHATPVGYGDVMVRNYKAITPSEFNMPFLLQYPMKFVFGFTKPKKKILGAEFAGEVESVGKNVKLFKEGDKLFGYPSMNMGSYAEYICMPQKGTMALKPENMSFEEASAVPYGGITALKLLKKLNIRNGQKVLINGASGTIGSAALQIAKNHFGAEVTGVCSTPRLEYVESLGADKVIDYTKEDFTRNGETYDVIFDILGRSSISKCKNSLNKNGIHFFASFKMKHLFQMMWTKIKGGKRVICAVAPDSAEELVSVKELVEAGKIRSVIDKQFPLEEAAEAHRYVEAGHKKGNVVIKIDHDNKN